MKEKYVDMTDVIGHLAIEYNLPYLNFDDFVILAKRVVKIYNLEAQSRQIPFSTLCSYITSYVDTPWGRKALRELI